MVHAAKWGTHASQPCKSLPPRRPVSIIESGDACPASVSGNEYVFRSVRDDLRVAQTNERGGENGRVRVWLRGQLRLPGSSPEEELSPNRSEMKHKSQNSTEEDMALFLLDSIV